MNNLPAIGERIGDYEVLGRIGAGGMGVVYYARDLKLDRPVALKFLPANLGYTAKEKHGLLKEARVISALDHANICTIYAIEERVDPQTGQDQFFIVMGYYDGGTLADRIAAGPIPPGDVVDLLTGVALGLAAAHARRVVHRDIKPSNILLTRDGLVKIADFGLAKMVNSSSQTQSLETSGTLAYMAPEQIRGEPTDHRADIWAVGVVAAEMLTGVHPFKRDNLAAAAFSICNHAPRMGDDGSKKVAQVGSAPPELLRIVYRCLSKDPLLRYQSSDELLSDLRTLRTGGLASSAPSHSTANLTGDLDRRSATTQRKALERSIAAASGAQPVRTHFRKWWIAALSAGLVLFLLLLPGVRERLAGAMLSPTEKHIAVLPFDMVGGNSADQALAAGLMDSMTGALCNLDAHRKSLWIVPATLVRSQKVGDPSSALKVLGATMVVKGSVAHSGKVVSITADLINTRTMREVGSASAESSDGDLAAAQRDIVTQLGRMLNVSAATAGQPEPGSSAPAAYDLYLQALGYMQRFDKPGNLDLAITQLQTATGEDPQFALAYGTEGEAYRLKFESDRDNRWVQPALSNCQQAIKLNPMLAGAYVTLGDIHAVTGHPELAQDEFQRALSINANNPAAVSGLAWSYEQAGKLDAAEAEYKKALLLRPGDWYSNNRLALFYDRHGHYDDAIAQVKRSIELTPDNSNVYYDLGAFYLDEGNPANYPEAESALRKSLQISPNYPAYGNLGLLYLEERRYTDAAAMAEKALAINDQDVLPWSYSELAYRWLHQDGKAAAALARIEDLSTAAVKVDAQDGQAHSWLGLAYAKQGQRAKALPHIEAAMALAPGDSQVLVNSIEAYAMIGDEAAALRLMQQARKGHVSVSDLKLDPDMQSLLSKTGL